MDRNGQAILNLFSDAPKGAIIGPDFATDVAAKIIAYGENNDPRELVKQLVKQRPKEDCMLIYHVIMHVAEEYSQYNPGMEKRILRYAEMFFQECKWIQLETQKPLPKEIMKRIATDWLYAVGNADAERQFIKDHPDVTRASVDGGLALLSVLHFNNGNSKLADDITFARYRLSKYR